MASGASRHPGPRHLIRRLIWRRRRRTGWGCRKRASCNPRLALRSWLKRRRRYPRLLKSLALSRPIRSSRRRPPCPLRSVRRKRPERYRRAWSAWLAPIRTNLPARRARYQRRNPLRWLPLRGRLILSARWLTHSSRRRPLPDSRRNKRALHRRHAFRPPIPPCTSCARQPARLAHPPLRRPPIPSPASQTAAIEQQSLIVRADACIRTQAAVSAILSR